MIRPMMFRQRVDPDPDYRVQVEIRLFERETECPRYQFQAGPNQFLFFAPRSG